MATSIDAIFADIDSNKNPAGSAGSGIPDLTKTSLHDAVDTHQTQFKRGGDIGWMTAVARFTLGAMVLFAVVFVVSLPVFQDWVLAWLPKAMTPAGTLSNTGAFFKATVATAAWVVLANILNL